VYFVYFVVYFLCIYTELVSISIRPAVFCAGAADQQSLSINTGCNPTGRYSLNLRARFFCLRV